MDGSLGGATRMAEPAAAASRGRVAREERAALGGGLPVVHAREAARRRVPSTEACVSHRPERLWREQRLRGACAAAGRGTRLPRAAGCTGCPGCPEGAPNDRPIHSSGVEQVTPRYTGRAAPRRRPVGGVWRSSRGEERGPVLDRTAASDAREAAYDGLAPPHEVALVSTPGSGCARGAGRRDYAARIQRCRLGRSGSLAAAWLPDVRLFSGLVGASVTSQSRAVSCVPASDARQSESCRPRTPGARGRGRVRGKAGAER